MLNYVVTQKSSVETFVLRQWVDTESGMLVNVVVKESPQAQSFNNVAQQIVIVIKSEEIVCLVLKEKSYQDMQNVMDNVLKYVDMFFLHLAKIVQDARDMIQWTFVME